MAAVFAAFLSLLLPSAHAEATTSSPWVLALHDSFTHGINKTTWGAYSGQPGGNPYGWWSPSHLVPYGGSALLRGYRENGKFVTAGMMLNTLPQTYGKYVVRAKFTKSANVEHVMLLWPTSGWPPEVDFSEGPTSKGIMATSHWGSANYQAHRFLNVDMTVWHSYGVEWTPTSLRFWVDGRPWASMTGAAVPKQPMRLAIQTAATGPIGGVTLANPFEVRMTIADVYVWKYRP